jgi:ABC-type phosphate transport system substrate-binding protein
MAHAACTASIGFLIAADDLGDFFPRGGAEMTRNIRSLAFLVVLGLLSVTAMAGEAQPKPLIFAGSGTTLAITRILAEAYKGVRPEVTIEVAKSIGSAAGMQAAADGAIAVGLISRPLKEDEKKLGLTVLPYARTVLVIGVHPTVPDDNITFDDLINIYKRVKTR